MKRGFLKSLKGQTALEGPAQEIAAEKERRRMKDLYADTHKPYPPNEPSWIFQEIPRSLDDVALPAGSVVITCLPDFSSDSKPPPSTQCVAWPGFSHVISSQPEFPKQVKTPPGAKAHRLFESPGKGMGLVARRGIRPYDYIICERPLLVSRPLASLIRSTVAEAMSEKERQIHWEAILTIAFERMTPEHKDIYRGFSKSPSVADETVLQDVFQTHAISMLEVEELLPPSDRGRQDRTLYAVCNSLSRVNHSCSPNSMHHFHCRSFSVELQALRQIPSGEEITVAYAGCNLLHSAVKRQKSLFDRYGFICSCTACSNPAESDRIREELSSIPDPDLQRDFYGEDGWIANKSLSSDSLIDDSLRFVSLAEREGLQAAHAYKLHLTQLCLAYAAIGDADKSAYYAGEASIAYMAAGREKMAAGFSKMSEEPTENPFWQQRVQ